MDESERHWEENRGEYNVPLYSSIASRQKEELLLQVSKRDPLLEGIEIDSGDPEFHKFASLAKEAFNSSGPFARISLRADPWTYLGSWRIMADNTERNIGTDLVKKHLQVPALKWTLESDEFGDIYTLQRECQTDED